jgi:hypothetical protein
MVYYSPKPDRRLKIADSLEEEDVIPGFSLPLAELFAELEW